MNLEQVLRTHWGNTASLAALVPLERVFTGPVPSGTALPAASLRVERQAVVVQTSHHHVYRVEACWHVLAAGLEQARQVTDQVRQAFHQAQLTGSDDQVLWLRFAGVHTERHEEELWEEVVCFDGLLALAHTLG